MNVRCFGCGKFGWLSSEAEDRELSEVEIQFLERHRAVCAACARKEEASAMALNMLRQSGLESLESGSRFENRIRRRVRAQAMRLGLRYWSPAVYGGAIAAVAIVAALQLLAHTSRLPVFRTTHADARRIEVVGPMFPTVPIANRIQRIE